MKTSAVIAFHRLIGQRPFSVRTHGTIAVRLVILVVVAGGFVAAILTQRAVARLRVENQALLAQSQEAQQLAAENNSIPQLRQAGQESERLRREIQDLPGLRNEVRQLRRQAEELQKLRSENERLVSEQAAAKTQPVAPAMPADFIPRAALGDAGLGTPEATVQTALWAMCQGNLERLAQCSLDGSAGFNGAVDSERRGIIEHMRDFPGFRIAQRQDISDHEVVLGLQASSGGTIMPMKLARVGSEWKLLR